MAGYFKKELLMFLLTLVICQMGYADANPQLSNHGLPKYNALDEPCNATPDNCGVVTRSHCVAVRLGQTCGVGMMTEVRDCYSPHNNEPVRMNVVRKCCLAHCDPGTNNPGDDVKPQPDITCADVYPECEQGQEPETLSTESTKSTKSTKATTSTKESTKSTKNTKTSTKSHKSSKETKSKSKESTKSKKSSQSKSKESTKSNKSTKSYKSDKSSKSKKS